MAQTIRSKAHSNDCFLSLRTVDVTVVWWWPSSSLPHNAYICSPFNIISFNCGNFCVCATQKDVCGNNWFSLCKGFFCLSLPYEVYCRLNRCCCMWLRFNWNIKRWRYTYNLSWRLHFAIHSTITHPVWLPWWSIFPFHWAAYSLCDTEVSCM